jgi:hypothetical protein
MLELIQTVNLKKSSKVVHESFTGGSKFREMWESGLGGVSKSWYKGVLIDTIQNFYNKVYIFNSKPGVDFIKVGRRA